MNDLFASSALLIPAYQPNDSLVRLAEQLRQFGFDPIIVINDGSDNTDVFSRLVQIRNLSVIDHEENLGKGAALKTGFRHVLEHFPSTIKTFITVDADGQHLPQDVLAVAQAAFASPESLILGVRNFGKKVPLKSKIGNSLTRAILGWAGNINLQDTQTGLRAYPRDFAKETLKIPSNHYDFELASIIQSSLLELSIHEIPIATIYIDDNKSSHFRPLLDSMRVYAVFARFVIVSLTSFFIDITIFALAYALSHDVYYSTYIARALSSSFNFIGNKHLVFKAHEKQKLTSQIISYFSLVILMAMVSATLVIGITKFTDANIVLIKVFVDMGLFLLNFLIQKTVLFRHNKNTAAPFE